MLTRLSQRRRESFVNMRTSRVLKIKKTGDKRGEESDPIGGTMHKTRLKWFEYIKRSRLIRKTHAGALISGSKKNTLLDYKK